MKHIAALVFIILIPFYGYGKSNLTLQTSASRDDKDIDERAKLYITTGTGFNNNTGILGFNLEARLIDNFTVDAGIGTGTWNNKLYLGGKYYLKPTLTGFAFGAGVTHATGTQGYSYEITSVYGNVSSERINKNAQTNVLLAAYHFWRLGRKFNRVYMESGWSFPVTAGNKITQLTGEPISYKSENSLKSGAPAGFILAIGISVCLAR